MKKFLFYLIVIGIIVGIIIGRNKAMNLEEENKIENQEVEEKIITYELNLAISDIDTLNPLRTKNSHVSDILKFIYEPLLSYDFEKGLQGVLAESWGQKDEHTWIIKLKPDVLWHGGEKFSSEDVKFTIDLLKGEELDSIYRENVKNIRSVDIVDDTTIVLTLESSDAYLPSKLIFPIIPKYYFKSEGIMDENKANRPVGTGPYQYESADETQLILVSNVSWWKTSEIKLSKIHVLKYETYGELIKGFKSSEVDMVYTNMHEWKEKFGFIGINSYEFESSEYELLIPNGKNVFLGDANVRKAILMAINRGDIISNIYDDMATVRDIPIGSSSQYFVKTLEYNPEEAKQLLMEAGYVFSKNGWNKNNKKLSLTLIIPENDEDKMKSAEKIKQYLEEISIPITIKKQKWNDFKKNISNDNFELALASLDIKNEYQIQDLVTENHFNNYANYANREMENIIIELKNSAEDIYEGYMRSFIRLYEEEMPYIGLYFKNNVILTNKSVKGQYESTFNNPYQNIIYFSK